MGGIRQPPRADEGTHGLLVIESGQGDLGLELWGIPVPLLAHGQLLLQI